MGDDDPKMVQRQVNAFGPGKYTAQERGWMVQLIAGMMANPVLYTVDEAVQYAEQIIQKLSGLEKKND